MTDAKPERALWDRLSAVLRTEFSQLRPRQHLLGFVSRALPTNVGADTRAALLRLRGIHVGPRTVLYGTPDITGGQSRGFENLSIGADCSIESGCAFEVGDTIAIGDRVTIQHQVLVITTTHDIGPREQRCGRAVHHPVRIEDDVVLGARSVVLPGVTIGAGAIVEAGSVVNKSVAPNTRVRGIPAKRVESPP